MNKRRFDYGMSLAYGPNTASTVIEAYHSSVFTAAQVPENIATDIRFKELGLNSVDICNLFPLSLTHSVAEQSKRIVDGFVSQFSAFVGGECVFDCLNLDFELSEVGLDKGRLERCVALLKRLSVQMHGKGITLCLPVRIPDVSSCEPQFYQAFLEQLMCYDVQLCLDVHPHELSKGYSAEELLKWNQFDMKTVRFIYEPETGNQLVEPLLKPWIDFLKKRCFTGNVIFAPVISSESYFCDEMHSLEDLISKI